MNDNNGGRVPDNPPNELLLHRSEPEARAVLEDWHESQGSKLYLTWLNEPAGGGGGDGYDYDGGGGGGDGDGYDGGYDGGDDGDGDDGGGGGYGGGGGGYGGGGGGGGGYNQHKQQEENMRDGLRIIAIGGGYYNFVTIGWLKRVRGDEYEIHASRTFKRFGGDGSWSRLARGPLSDPATLLAEPTPEPEPVHRLLIRRAIPCDVEAWAEECPCPDSWKGE